MRGRTWTTTWAGVVSALSIAALSACGDEPSATSTQSHGAQHGGVVADAVADDLEEVLRAVKRLTKPYRELGVAKKAGYNAQLTPCMESPPLGGMGFHYGAPGLIDGTVQPLKPEILMYEPKRNGDLQLVGVEYVVPYTAWNSEKPPTLVGVPFHRNDAFGLWVLHAWIWKANPSGKLTDWNPRVTCRFANDQS